MGSRGGGRTYILVQRSTASGNTHRWSRCLHQVDWASCRLRLLLNCHWVHWYLYMQLRSRR
jgi:hypothetical protein